MQLDERLISLRQLKMMSPWKQIVLLSITGCLAGKILERGLYWCLSEYIVTVDVTTSSLLSLSCIFINNQPKCAATRTYPVSHHHVLQGCQFATPQRATGLLFLFTARPDHYQNPCKEFSPAV